MVLLRNLFIKLIFFYKDYSTGKNWVKVVRYKIIFNDESNVVINDVTQMLPVLY